MSIHDGNADIGCHGGTQKEGCNVMDSIESIAIGSATRYMRDRLHDGSRRRTNQETP
jgi:hypothetical protein